MEDFTGFRKFHRLLTTARLLYDKLCANPNAENIVKSMQSDNKEWIRTSIDLILLEMKGLSRKEIVDQTGFSIEKVDNLIIKGRLVLANRIKKFVES